MPEPTPRQIGLLRRLHYNRPYKVNYGKGVFEWFWCGNCMRPKRFDDLEAMGLIEKGWKHKGWAGEYPYWEYRVSKNGMKFIGEKNA